MEKGEGEMYGESNMETYNTTCKTENQWEFAEWLGELKQGLCNNLEAWDGEEDGREVQKGRNISVSMVDFCWWLKEKQNSVKQLSFN